jgi:ATP-binding cassette subfamily B protein
LGKEKPASSRRTLRVLTRSRGTIFTIVAALLLEGSFRAFLPFSAGVLVDRSMGGKDRETLVLIVAILAGGFFASQLIGLFRDSLFARLQSRSLATIRQSMFERLQQFSLSFHAAREPEEVLDAFAGDLGIIESAFSMTPTWGAMPAIESLIFTGVILWIDWRIGLLSLLLWPWVILAPQTLTKQVNLASESCKDEEVRILGVVEESLTARLVIRAFSLDHLGLALFRKRNEMLQKGTKRAAFLSALMDRFTQAGILFLQVAILGLSALLAFSGQITAGRLVSIPILTWMLAEALLLVSEYRPALAEAQIAWRRILETLRDPAPVLDARDAKPLAALHREIVFNEVTFSYGDAPALNGATVRVAKGSCTAFVGPSGSGKSMMLRMLMRFLDPQKGSVSIDDVPLKNVAQASLRARIGFVLPENFIFNATIRENIRLGHPDASEERVRDVVKTLGILDSPDRLPQGLDTMVGENGFPLSENLKQRLALARALLRSPDLLLLDDIGSELEPGEEIAIHETVRAMSRGRTVIEATHRLSNVANADAIFVFSEGKIEEQGTHAELLAKDGLYAAIWRRQTGFRFSADGRNVTVSVERMKQMPVIGKLSDELAAELAGYFITETLPAGREIVRKGDPGDRFYTIVRGRAEIWKTDEESGEEVAVFVLEDGDSFGEVALLADLPCSETVRTSTLCTIVSLGRAQFNIVIEKSPELRQLMTEAAGHLRESADAATLP